MDRVRIAVLMTSYNRCDITLACLTKLFAAEACSSACSINVFLVDDASSDGTGERVRKLFPQVHVISGSGALYWAKGMYKAWCVSMKRGWWDAYLWLNDDTLLNSSALDEMMLVYERRRIVVGELEDDTGTIVYGVRNNGLFTGNCVLVPDEICKRLGLICGDYSHAWADSDYAMRAKRAGVSVVSAGVVGTAEWHPNRPSLKNRSLGERLSLLRDPKGWNLHDLWLYRRRNWGFFAAVASCVHLILHVIIGER